MLGFLFMPIFTDGRCPGRFYAEDSRCPHSGEMSLVNTINDIIDQLAIFADKVKKVAREVGTEGKLGVQAEVGNVQGIWQKIT